MQWRNYGPRDASVERDGHDTCSGREIIGIHYWDIVRDAERPMKKIPVLFIRLFSI